MNRMWYHPVLQRAAVKGHRWYHEHKELLGMVSIYNINIAQLKPIEFIMREFVTSLC